MECVMLRLREMLLCSDGPFPKNAASRSKLSGETKRLGKRTEMSSSCLPLVFCKKQFRLPLPWSTSWEQRSEGLCAAKSQRSPEQPNKPWAQAIFIYLFSHFICFSPSWHTDKLYDLKTVPLGSWFIFFFPLPTGKKKELILWCRMRLGWWCVSSLYFAHGCLSVHIQAAVPKWWWRSHAIYKDRF